MTIPMLCLLSLACIAAPFVAAHSGQPLGGVASASLTIFGILLLCAAAVLTVFTKLYQKTKANEAFVRTGAGGVKVIRDGGAIIVPILHELIRVSLQTLKLEVQRDCADALITEDKLRADIRAEFFVRVQPDRDSILQAARSLGDSTNPVAVKALVEDKLVSALRTAAASKTLEQLNSERDAFLAEVVKLVADDLHSNGLVLETVTISKLDQTDEQYLKAENIFDAQGRRKIAEITQLNLTERNRLVREGEQARKRQDVGTRQELLELERQEREAHARQQAEVKKIEADTLRAAEEKRIEAERQVELAEVEKRRTLEIALRKQEQASEVAEREKQELIAIAEKKRAAAERELAEAEAERERARQLVETVRLTEEAERLKKKQVIDAEAQAEQLYVSEQRRADAEAYTRHKAAEAQRLTADAESEAIRKKAAADAEAERMRAEGATARAMVPIEVMRAELAIERDRIESVVKAELEAREKHGRVAQEFEIAKLRIEAEKEVRVAIAGAQASLFSKMEANLYGTPQDVERIMTSLVSGQRVATAIDGFAEAINPQTLQTVSSVAEAVIERLSKKAEPAPATEPYLEPGEELDLAGE